METAPSGRFSVLSYDQVHRLHSVLEEIVPIHGRGNFPTLEMKLKDLVQVVRGKLEQDGVKVREVRLNGSVSNFVLAAGGQPVAAAADQNGGSQLAQNHIYKDLDLIFAVEFSSQRVYDKVKNAVLESLLDFLPEGVNKKRISSCSLKEAYVHKLVKVTDGDKWSLISLSNNCGRNVELKFVDSMKRQFEFSVDSFQIMLDSLLLFYGCAEMPMSENFYPTVVADSVYGDFQEALMHLQRKLIATRHPEEIRGGGLLKYCNLLVRGFRASDPDEIKTLERYMCSRFFIDFPDVHVQQCKLETYLANHFAGEEHFIYSYLVTLHRVVDESTVCLMGHERRQTLGLIEELACHVFFIQQQHNIYVNATSCSSASSSTSSSQSSTPTSTSPSSPNSPNANKHHQQQQQPFMFYYTPYVAPTPPHVHHHHQHHHSHHHHYSSSSNSNNVNNNSHNHHNHNGHHHGNTNGGFTPYSASSWMSCA